jgi:hypothetical protein
MEHMDTIQFTEPEIDLILWPIRSEAMVEFDGDFGA